LSTETEDQATDDRIAEAAHQLLADTTLEVDPIVVAELVRGCLRDLAGVQSAALPEMAYRLARHRLVTLTSPGTD